MKRYIFIFIEFEKVDTVYSLFLTLVLRYMRSECFPEMSTHQTFHLILSSSNIKYMLLDNKFPKKTEDNNNFTLYQ